MTERSELGVRGEAAAAVFLERKGYRVIARNVREPWGELDIVAAAPDGTLVFAEVKTMNESFDGAQGSGLQPEDHMTAGKRERFTRVAELYAGAHPELVSDEKGWRLDLLALVRKPGGFLVRHYENI